MGKALQRAALVLPRGYLHGLTLSTAGSSATFSVAIGEACTDDFTDIMTLGTSISKTTSAWAVGSTNGGLDTGSIAINTWYHVYLIKRPDTGVVDVLVSLSATAPTMPTNYTIKRRIGTLRTNGSSQWVLFSQNGDEFLWSSPIQDLASTSITSTAVSVTLTVPTGIKVDSLIYVQIDRAAGGGNTALYVSCLDVNDDAVNIPGVAGFSSLGIYAAAVTEAIAYAELRTRTNTSAQIRIRGSAAINNTWIYTYGWIDTRGKLF